MLRLIINYVTIMIVDLWNIIFQYSDNNDHKEYFYNKYANKITENHLTSNKPLDLSIFKKLKKLSMIKERDESAELTEETDKSTASPAKS